MNIGAPAIPKYRVVVTSLTAAHGDIATRGPYVSKK
jgi:hypothetical protein